MVDEIPNFLSGGNSSGTHFNQCIALHEPPFLSWESRREQIPVLSRGWYELSRLPIEDRIEFTRDYWLSQLPFAVAASLEKKLKEFFVSVEDVGIFATQDIKEGPFELHMVYTLSEEMGFFHGFPPATSESIDKLVKSFGQVTFPTDYLAFLRIHDGFSKYTDTGLIRIRDMVQVYQRLQHLFSEEILIRPDGQVIRQEQLIPFYESFGLHAYQCFYADWYPEAEMGNIYFSEHECVMSNFLAEEEVEENGAFPSFLAWLIFYLEGI